MSEARIYVACLASYNNGRLHGVWIDCDGKDSADIWDEVAAMLRASPYPNVTVECPDCAESLASEDVRHEARLIMGGIAERPPAPRCNTCNNTRRVPSAEEWAIHDHEGLGDLIGESTSFDDVAAIAEIMGDSDQDKRRGLIWLIKDIGCSLADAIDKCGDVRTTDESATDYAASFVDDVYSEKELGPLAAYIDYERFARDLLLGGDIAEAEVDGERFIITNASEF